MTSYQESDAASRRDETQSALGCLIPLIASTVILAIGITLFSWLVLSDDGEEARAHDQEVAADGESDEESDEPGGGQARDNPIFTSGSVSNEALVEVVRSGKWQEFGQPEVYDLGSQSRVQRKFRRQVQSDEDQPAEEQRVRITIHTFKSSGASQPVLEQTEMPARAVQFDNKVVVIEPMSGAAERTVEPLAQRLRRFRDLLDEQDESP